MKTLRDFALAHKGGKDLCDLDKVPLDIEIKEGEFEKNGGKVKYNYIEINDWKYSLKSELIAQIQTVALTRPTCKHIKFQKAPNGTIFVIPLD